MTIVSRRDRRHQASLARAVVHNAGTFGRGAAVAVAATGLVVSTGAAANAGVGSASVNDGREVTTLQVSQSDLTVERASNNTAVTVTASPSVDLTFDRPSVGSESAPEPTPEPEVETETQSVALSHTLHDYLPGTRGLVEQLAELEGVSAEGLFEQLFADGTFVDENGVLDHGALAARVAELSPQQAEEPAQQETQEQAPQQEAPQQEESQEQAQTESQESSQEASAEVELASAQEEAPQEESSGSLSAVVSAAYSGIGTPYVWGGKGPGGWDCSGFTAWAYAQAGYSIPSSTAAVRSSGQFRWTDNPQPGDIVVQNGGGHIAIYVGNGQFIGAQNPNSGTLLYSYETRPGNSHVGYLTLR
ncbi:C40 family peptidase [Nesterenkonia sp. CL21]|uniref:C40 family peptidase n=1 Tax=Nesterenkonia sp. CL21 TaxID=3064894 RepID=UPI0028785EFA|nr:C40 family peptidase [Nesterenkonia sp. CL21]MDS2172325.1 C40 family peptidase [Nesterenkonia sp. CL21]